MRQVFPVVFSLVLGLLSGIFAKAAEAEAAGQTAPAVVAEAPAKASKVVVIPIRDQIAKPVLYIVRRGLKQAIEEKADTVILDMETPGGELGVMLEILEALGKFPGKTVTFVNNEAISAGALIAAGTQEIYFAPEGVIGAAAPVQSTGADIDETMRDKVVSFMKARVRAMPTNKGHRGEVISAMIDRNFELKIDDKVIKPKGELLSLTAKEAMTPYGKPPEPLLGAGIAKNLDELFVKIHGSGNHQVTRLEVTWSEKLAQYLTLMTPLLLSVGILCLFIEFKTPGFGIFGISGIVLLAVVFLGHHVAGLSGFEPLIFFLLGILLLAVEIFFFPGTVVLAVTGVALILGSLAWAMVDHWPGEPISISGDALIKPLFNVMGAVVISVVLFLLILRFLPKGVGPWSRMILTAEVGGEPGAIRALNAPQAKSLANSKELVGRKGIAATALFPSGQIEIDGKRYEAKLAVGFAERGAEVAVTGVSEFGLIVEVCA